MSDRKKCTICGEELSQGVEFCESCGAKVSHSAAATTAPATSGEPIGTGNEEPASPDLTHPPVSWRRRTLIGGIAAIVLFAGGLAAGYFAFDDSSEVSELKTQLTSTQQDLENTNSEREDLADELDGVSEERSSLAKKLKAERSISGKLPSPDKSIEVSADADYVLGEAGAVGPTIMRPSDLTTEGQSGGGLRYTLAVEVKNDGKEPIGPFCGGQEATVVDSTGRRYSGESVLSDSSPNCMDDIQPGLSKSGYTMEFILPKDAKPALIELLFESYSDEDPVTWAVE